MATEVASALASATIRNLVMVIPRVLRRIAKSLRPDGRDCERMSARPIGKDERPRYRVELAPTGKHTAFPRRTPIPGLDLLGSRRCRDFASDVGCRRGERSPKSDGVCCWRGEWLPSGTSFQSFHRCGCQPLRITFPLGREINEPLCHHKRGVADDKAHADAQMQERAK
jgi:hypothetical protein